MEEFPRKGYFPPGCRETSTLARGLTSAVRWLHKLQGNSNQPMGVEFPHRARRYRPGGHCFRARVVGVVLEVRKASDPWMGLDPAQGRTRFWSRG